MKEKKPRKTWQDIMRSLPVFFPMKEYASKALGFSDLLPYAIKIDDHIVLNKDGSFMVSYRYRGEDLESASRQDLAWTANRLNDAVRRFESGWMFHFTSERRPAAGYPEGSQFTDPTAWMIDECRRIRYGEEGEHYSNDYTIDVTWLPPNEGEQKTKEFFIQTDEKRDANYQMSQNIKYFEEKLRAFEGMVGPDLNLQRLGCRNISSEYGTTTIDDQLSHIARCVTNQDIELASPPAGAYLSPVVANSDLRGGFKVRIGNKLISILVVGDVPAYSYPGLFDVLSKIGASYKVSWRYIVREREAALRDIEFERLRWFGKRRSMGDAFMGRESGRFPNLDAEAMADDANLAASKLQSGEVVFGYFTMSIVVWERIEIGEEESEARVRLEKVKEHVSAYLNRMHIQTYDEEANAIDAFLGTLPGLGNPQVRKFMLSSRNLADFLPVTAVWGGHLTAPCPFYPEGSPPLAYVSTVGSTPHALNLHVGDVGHFFVTGGTGAGKSVLLGFIIAQHRRYKNSRQIIFDVDRSHYALCRSVGGYHYEVGDENSIRFAPLAFIHERAERQWAEGWILSLLSNQGVDPMRHRAAIRMALENMSKSGPPYSISALMAQPFIEPEVREALQPYSVDGTLGGILDGEEDMLQDGDFLCFEMRLVLGMPREYSEPILNYLFHYMERLCTGRPTLLLLEEVWAFLQNDNAANAMTDWLKTMRKKNVAVGFANQSLKEFVDSKISSTLIENCLTKILLPYPDAKTEFGAETYKKIGLNAWQIDQIARAEKKRDYYVVSSEGKRMIALELSPVELAFIGISAKDDIPRLRAMIEEEERLIREYGDLPLNKHVPWQARWIEERVEGPQGKGWARKWIEAWKALGGYRRTQPVAWAEYEKAVA